MRKYASVALWGLLISSVGSIPLGTLNVSAMQIAVSAGLHQAVYFSLGVALVEIIYVRICLVALHWLRSHSRLLRMMDWVALLIVLLLAAGSFNAAFNPVSNQNFVLQIKLPYFLLGLFMSALNPVQIPFWLGWTNFLFGRNILKPATDFYNFYVAGIGIGTLAGLALFVFTGRVLVSRLNSNQSAIHTVIGGIFLITAVVQLVKLLRHKGLAENTNAKAALMQNP